MGRQRRTLVALAACALLAAGTLAAADSAGSRAACSPEWRQVAVRLPGGDFVNDVAAYSERAVWLAGETLGHRYIRAFALRWDGARFRVVAPPRGSGSLDPSAIAVVSPRDVWAV